MSTSNPTLEKYFNRIPAPGDDGPSDFAEQLASIPRRGLEIIAADLAHLLIWRNEKKRCPVAKSDYRQVLIELEQNLARCGLLAWERDPEGNPCLQLGPAGALHEDQIRD